ncbi:MAG: FcoT family thioesterase [Candidatus Woesearchaeota archaeon]|jgi:hypothetical protein
MDIEKSLVEKVCEMYHLPLRYLQAASILYTSETGVEGTVVTGIFQIQGTEYQEPVGHVTEIQMNFCTNQLAYVLFGQLLTDKRWQGMEGIDVQEYLALKADNVFIARSIRKYKKQIDPCRPFTSQLILEQLRREENFYLAKVALSFDTDAVIGDITFVLKYK